MTDIVKWPNFPEGVRDIFEDVWQDIAFLHSKWNLYLDLFANLESIMVLNRTTPSAFQLIEESLRVDMTMTFKTASAGSVDGSR